MSKEIEEEVIETEEEPEESEEETEEETEEPDLKEELEAKDRKIKELEDLIARKKKENKKPVEAKETVKADSELSQNDLYALIKNDVHEDDIEEVVEYSKLKKISVKEALQSGVVKAILKDKEETRKTAEVSNTGNTRKGPTPKDVDSLVSKARKGDLPDNPEDMVKVFERMKGLDRK